MPKPSGISGSQYDSYEKKSEAAPLVDDLISQAVEGSMEKRAAVLGWTGEKACCANENKPCQHWIWDASTGEGYRNALSGRYREVE